MCKVQTILHLISSVAWPLFIASACLPALADWQLLFVGHLTRARCAHDTVLFIHATHADESHHIDVSMYCRRLLPITTCSLTLGCFVTCVVCATLNARQRGVGQATLPHFSNRKSALCLIACSGDLMSTPHVTAAIQRRRASSMRSATEDSSLARSGSGWLQVTKQVSSSTTRAPYLLDVYDSAVSATSAAIARPECEALLAFRCVHLSPEFVIRDHSALVCEMYCCLRVFRQ